ncbi:hypothetical protein BACFIN_06871 [Bacteroides finegoldii DSM 17565]|nr:hypothetical protein BACFIN_06871 [Bacteroides finegoldii DSM 17565]
MDSSLPNSKYNPFNTISHSIKYILREKALPLALVIKKEKEK